jgi:hypothetical protein
VREHIEVRDYRMHGAVLWAAAAGVLFGILVGAFVMMVYIGSLLDGVR